MPFAVPFASLRRSNLGRTVRIVNTANGKSEKKTLETVRTILIYIYNYVRRLTYIVEIYITIVYILKDDVRMLLSFDGNENIATGEIHLYCVVKVF